MMQHIKKHRSFPQERGENNKLSIDKNRGTAMIFDGNHRLTCAPNMDINLSPEYIKVDFVFHALGDNQELLPLCPKDWPTFLCGCDLGFMTKFTTNK